MPSEFRLPALGADMDEGTIVEWHVVPGSRVKRGDVVAIVETDKGAIDVEIFEDGVVHEIVVKPGTKVPVGTVLALLETEGSPPAPAPAGEGRGGGHTPVPAPAGEGAGGVREPSLASPPASSRVRISPAARKRARELGVEVESLQGSGPGGTVTLEDVGKAGQGGGMRAAIAAAMSRSKREIPHYYLAHTISMKHALAWLAETNAHLPIQDRILPGALLLRAVALALWEIPELNGFWVDGAYRASEEVHLGTAIALRTGGLIAPAILDADEKPLDQLMKDLHDLVARARAGRLRASEMTSATITVTSLGDRGCEAVWPVINPPQVAIIGFGAILERPWVEGTAVVPHPTVTATLAADHRVSDGHRGGLFLTALDRALQEPSKL